ncbi:MAG: S8 family serine peptidase, partial [Gaiellaceae bacterium]
VRRNGSVPDYSNRDAVYVDVAAPGDDMFSTIPSNLVASDTGCTEAYSDCGPFELRNAIGTSFAAPQVSAAAALLLGVDPTLTPDQVAYLIERSADDASTVSGCGACATGRDALAGWGTLDVASALARLNSGLPLPRPDKYEPNDDAGEWARTLPASLHALDASLDYWDDNLDVYRVRLFPGQQLYARLTPATAAKIRLQLWAPGTDHVDSLDLQSVRVADSRQVGHQVRLSYRARTRGVYYLSAKVVSRTPEPVQYHLAFAVSRRSP